MRVAEWCVVKVLVAVSPSLPALVRHVNSRRPPRAPSCCRREKGSGVFCRDGTSAARERRWWHAHVFAVSGRYVVGVAAVH